MTLERAINALRQVKSVNQWNDVRDFIKAQLTDDQWLTEYFVPIDASGLIVEVLGKKSNNDDNIHTIADQLS